MRYLDENMLLMAGGVPIVVGGLVVGVIGMGGAHGSEDVHLVKAGLRALAE